MYGELDLWERWAAAEDTLPSLPWQSANNNVNICRISRIMFKLTFGFMVYK